MTTIIYLLLAFWPLLTLVKLFSVGGVLTVDIVRPLVLLMAPAALLMRVSRGKKIEIQKAAVVWLFYCVYIVFNYFVVGSRSSLHSILAEVSIVFVTPLLMYFILTNLSYKLELRKLVLSLLASGIIISVTGILEWIAGRNLIGPINYEMYYEMTIFRPNGPFLEGIGYSATILIYIPFVYFFYRQKVIGRKLAFFSILLFTFACAIVLSRASIISLLLVLFILPDKKNAKNSFLMLAALIVAGLIAYLGWEIFISTKLYKARIADPGNVIGRYRQYMDCIQLFLENPIFGIGYDMYRRNHIFAIHNSFLRVLTELGVAGFILFVTYYGSLLLQDLKSSPQGRRADELKTRMMIVMIVVIVANTINLCENREFSFTLLCMLATFHLTREISTRNGVAGSKSLPGSPGPHISAGAPPVVQS